MNRKLFALGLALFSLPGLALMAGGQAPQSVNLQPGSPAPELVLAKILQAPEGAKVDWGSLRGKVVVVEFWATWCAPCIELQPHLNALADKFKDQPVYFISISDESEEVVAPFLKRRTLKGWVGLDPSHATMKAYLGGVSAIPKIVVVDQNGKIVTSMTGTQEGEKLSEDLLKQLLAGTGSATAANKPEQQLAAPKGNAPTGAIQPAATVKGGQPSTVGETKALDVEPGLLDITIKPSKAPDGTTARISSLPTGFSAYAAKLDYLLPSLLAPDWHSLFPTTRISIPAELKDKRFDITATVQSDATNHNFSLIVSALENALGIRIIRVTFETEVFILTAPKELTGSLQPAKSTGGHNSSAEGVLAAAATDLSRLANSIEKVLKTPVIDETGLQGKYDWDLVYDGKNPTSIIEAVRKQFGLELTPGKRPVELVIVEKK